MNTANLTLANMAEFFISVGWNTRSGYFLKSVEQVDFDDLGICLIVTFLVSGKERIVLFQEDTCTADDLAVQKEWKEYFNKLFPNNTA